MDVISIMYLCTKKAVVAQPLKKNNFFKRTKLHLFT